MIVSNIQTACHCHIHLKVPLNAATNPAAASVTSSMPVALPGRPAHSTYSACHSGQLATECENLCAPCHHSDIVTQA